jgi:hypothetical protein
MKNYDPCESGGNNNVKRGKKRKIVVHEEGKDRQI